MVEKMEWSRDRIGQTAFDRQKQLEPEGQQVHMAQKNAAHPTV
jgi:hypothetical protein